MWRFPALAILTCLSIQASSIVSYTCSVGTTTATPCPETGFGLAQGLTNPPFNSTHASAFAQVIQPSLENISAHAASSAFYQFCPMCPLLTASVSAKAIVNDTDYTTGAVRSGFIQISESIYSLHAQPGTNWSISDGVHDYNTCLGPGFAMGCSGTKTLPFDLGVPFFVNATAMDSVSLAPPFNGSGADDLVTLTFTLFEANGTTPVSVFATPEPSACALVLWGLITLSISSKYRRNRA